MSTKREKRRRKRRKTEEREEGRINNNDVLTSDNINRSNNIFSNNKSDNAMKILSTLRHDSSEVYHEGDEIDDNST